MACVSLQRSMKVLLLTKKCPWPLKDGEVVAIHNMVQGYAAMGHEVTVLCINTLKHYTAPESLPDDIKKLAKYMPVTHDTGVKPLAAVRNLFSSRSYHVDRFISEPFRKTLIDLLKKEQFDLVQCEGLYMGPYVDDIRQHHNGPLVMRCHNVEAEIWQRVANDTNSLLKSIYLKLQAGRLATYEHKQLNRYDALLPISEKDAQFFEQLGCNKPMHVVPAGIDIKKYDGYIDHKAEPLRVGFIGSLDWMPNLEGLKWFANEVWPQVRAQVKGARFQIAGRNMPAYLNNWNNHGIEVLGEVDDQYEFMSRQQVLVVPLFSGSGMRIKIIEGMALGRAVVSTTIGAEGINFTEGQNMLVADDARTFSLKVATTLITEGRAEEIGKEARQFIAEHFDNRVLVQQVLGFLKSQFSI